MNLAPSESAMIQAYVRYKSLPDEEKTLMDDITTPFCWAMKLDGYKPELHPAGCLILRQCPVCNGSSSTKYTKGGDVFWGCPCCHAITPDTN